MQSTQRRCMGFPPAHSAEFRMGEYRTDTFGRQVTVRGVEVRECGCRIYPSVGALIRAIEANPRKRVFTWHEKAGEWK